MTDLRPGEKGDRTWRMNSNSMDTLEGPRKVSTGNRGTMEMDKALGFLQMMKLHQKSLAEVLQQ